MSHSIPLEVDLKVPDSGPEVLDWLGAKAGFGGRNFQMRLRLLIPASAVSGRLIRVLQCRSSRTI